MCPADGRSIFRRAGRHSQWISTATGCSPNKCASRLRDSSRPADLPNHLPNSTTPQSPDLPLPPLPRVTPRTPLSLPPLHRTNHSLSDDDHLSPQPRHPSLAPNRRAQRAGRIDSPSADRQATADAKPGRGTSCPFLYAPDAEAGLLVTT